MIGLIRQPLVHLQALLLMALLLGGGGVIYGWRHLAIELAALVVLAFNPAAVRRFLSARSWGLVPLVAVTVMLPLLQAVPLPPIAWQALPGRDLVIEAYGVSGINPDSWFSFSLDPVRSLVAFGATLAPLATIVVGCSLSRAQRTTLAWTLAILAGAALALGAVQLSSANTIGVLQDMQPEAGVFYALFSNRNSTGLFFVVIALVLIALPWSRTPLGLAMASGAVSVAVIAVMLTQSRSAMALALIVPLFAAARVLALWRSQRGARQQAGRGKLVTGTVMAAGIVVLISLAAVVSATTHGRIADAMQRFSQIDGDRLEMWDDSAYVARRYWPTGAGTGAFDDVFQVDESLEYVSRAKAGRAHNDYLELTIELGLPGLLVLAAWMVWIGLACRRRSRDPDAWLAWAAFVAAIVIALQSVLDYPLRNHAMLAVAGLLIVLLLPARESRV